LTNEIAAPRDNTAAPRDNIAVQLLAAQRKAVDLFAAIVDRGLIRAGKLESDLTAEIYDLAKDRFAVKRHWHKRIVRSGPHTLLGYYDGDSDRLISDDDVVYLDLGPVFEDWEADFGRTYVVGSDPIKHRLVANLADAFARGKEYFQRTPTITAGQLYDYVAAMALNLGWEFGARTAGHLIGRFPHERLPSDPAHFSIRHGNDVGLRELDDAGRPRHWILEIHLVDRAREFGGFYEELLTVDERDS
jgi:Xaa-Pro aminopeptidase